jgi:hypothetical protein
MNSKATFNLSEYQRATLTEMGIDSYRLLEKSGVSLAIKPTETHQKPIQNKQQAKNEVSEASIGPTEIPPIAVAPNVAEPKPLAIIDQVLLLMPEQAVHSPMLEDILLTLGLSGNTRLNSPEGKLEAFCDYQFAWQQSENINLFGNVLSTPSIATLSSAQSKKQLWLSLQTFILEAKT